jgi:multidrug efflux system membrane fusion protein
MLRQSLTAPTLLIALCALSACRSDNDSAEQARPVRTERISPRSGGIAATYSGEISARREAALGFMVGGRVLRRRVEIGDVVEVGTPLFQLDATDAALNANASRSQVESARSQLDQARSDYDRFAKLADAKFVSRADVEKMRLSLLTAQQGLRAAQANHGVVANQAAYTSLRSTTAGVVTAIEAEAGQVVQPGQIVVRIAERGEREVVISVPEARVDELRNARSLAIELWAVPQRRYVGRLREMAPDTDTVTRTYSARVSVLDADGQVRLGMTGKVLVALPQERSLRRVPLTAIYDADGTPKVWIVDPKTSRVATRPVTVTQAQKDGVLISAGLRDGDIVVTAGVNLLHAGQKVRTVAREAKGGTQS